MLTMEPTLDIFQIRDGEVYSGGLSVVDRTPGRDETLATDWLFMYVSVQGL